jgi:predicted dehydrogenase
MEKSLDWALAGTGWIVEKFLAGLRESGGRAAAVFSRTPEKARDFAAKNGIDKAFHDFDRMIDDPAIGFVYVATPHPSHGELSIRALRAGKAVLCEKPMALNARDAAEMIRAARENGVFLMEAMWTRFLPAVAKAREWLSLGAAGKPVTVQANFGFRSPLGPEHRLFDPALGGGALLDVGVYCLSFASMVFGGRRASDVKSRLFMGETGVDDEAAALVSYGGPRLANVSASLRTDMTCDARIFCDSGRIVLLDFYMARRAELYADDGSVTIFEDDSGGSGYRFEAAEVMERSGGGFAESEIMPLDETVRVLETMDAIRAQSGFKYPSE